MRQLGRPKGPEYTFFELRLDRRPELRLDNREIIGARWVSPDQLPGIALTGAATAYVRRG